MTLIASTLNHKMPFLISDLLWSSEYSTEHVRFPTNIFDPSPYLPSGQEDKPIKLGQKMYIIKDKVCIVFAGLSQEILFFLTLIKDAFKEKYEITKEDIHKFLQMYKLNRNFKDSAFFIIHIRNSTANSIEVTQFYSPSETNIVDPISFNVEDESWNIMYDDIYEQVFACGNGAKGFLNIVRQAGKLHTRFKQGDFRRAVQVNTILISKLLTLERISLYTLRENWGGGFETAYYNGEKFEKIDKIAYVISHGYFDNLGNIGLPVPRLIMYYKYLRDILYIVALEINQYTLQETERFSTFTSLSGGFNTTLYEVEGIDLDNIENYELPSDFSFFTDKISMGYSLITNKDVIFNPAFFNFGPALTITFQQGRSIEISILKDLSNKIRDTSKKIFPNL
ncbi:MAG: hypothetical protein Q8891_10215 [Bacteroidota bacterium]|nr:hypothetical protein [Bacteroidota bacterium]